MSIGSPYHDWWRILTRKYIVLTVFLCAGIGLLDRARSENSPQPLQLEMRVPFAPTAFPSAGRTYLVYELYLTNFTNNPLNLQRVEVLDADAPVIEPVAAFEGEQLDELLQPLGAQANRNSSGRQIAGGNTVVVFMWVSFKSGAHVPKQLRHRVVTADNAAEGAVIGTHQTEIKVLRSPLLGADWLASDAASNDADNHHRRGIFVYDGHALISRRYAIDWMLVKDGASFSGDARDKRAYYSYGKPVVAVADATVVTARDGLPDNVPGHNENFSPSAPITMDTVTGNTITLDLGSGQFAYYCHLQPGSVRVKVGEHVKPGQAMALIGDSGDAREPHLHFEIANSPKPFAGEGLPYLIDQYRVKSEKGWQSRTRELPLKDMVIDFGH
jgi:Peptidase family M23